MTTVLRVDPRPDETAELLSDCIEISEVLKQLLNACVTVIFFTSTDQGPEIWVKPNDELKRFAMPHHITRTVSQFNYLSSIKINEVTLKWLEPNFTKMVFNQ